MSDVDIVNQVFVPILGRPNVGKSTLFNRLVEADRALTGAEEGVTRDRLTERLSWNDNNFTLLDTAGYQTEHPAPDEAFVLRQVESMIDQGHCFLFVVDAQDGVTELDRKIAEELYPVSDQVLLVVNKADPPAEAESVKSDFYELGFANVCAVSALHDSNLESVKEWVSKTVPDRPSEELTEEGITVSFVGRPNVGKSTLFNAVLGYERVMVSEEPGTTRDFIDVTFDVEDQTFHLVDTGGMIRDTSVETELEQDVIYGSLKSIHYSDVVCLVLDWNERVTRQDQRIAGLIQDRYRGAIILVNKADEVDEDNEQNWLNHLRDRLYFLEYAPVLFTSGRTNRGLAAIFSTASDVYNQMQKRFEPEELTNAFLDLKSNLSWPSKDAGDVILQNIQQIDTNPVTLDITARHPERLKKNDLRYLRRQLRTYLELDISPLKLGIDSDDEDDA